MSRSKPRSKGGSNPAKKFIEYKNDQFQYYDKEIEEVVAIDIPLQFILLDELATVTGFNEASNSGIWSNEVRDVRDEVLKVQIFKQKGIAAEGIWKDIKPAVKDMGGRFTRTCYALYEGELVLFKFPSSVFSSWFDFTKELKGDDIYDHHIKVVDKEARKKGRVNYTVPIFELGDPLTDEEKVEAFEVDQKLQAYLEDYLAKNSGKATSSDAGMPNTADAEAAEAEEEMVTV